MQATLYRPPALRPQGLRYPPINEFSAVFSKNIVSLFLLGYIYDIEAVPKLQFLEQLP
jgi:hypothetical protein